MNSATHAALRSARALELVHRHGGNSFLAADRQSVTWLTGYAPPFGDIADPFAPPAVVVVTPDTSALLIVDDRSAQRPSLSSASCGLTKATTSCQRVPPVRSASKDPYGNVCNLRWIVESTSSKPDARRSRRAASTDPPARKVK
jgi:hypothetical protein